MTMAYAIEQLRSTGDPIDESIANILQLRIEARRDFALPTTPPGELTDSPDVAPHEEEATQPSLPEARHIGSIALATPDLLPIPEVRPDYNELVERTDALRRELVSIAQPIYTLANNQLPLARDNVRGMLGKLKKREEKEWEFSQEMKSRQLFYSFKIPYRPNETANLADELQLRVSKSTKGMDTDVDISYVFNNAAVQEIRFKGVEPYSDPADSYALLLDSVKSGNDSDKHMRWDVHVLGGNNHMLGMTKHAIKFDDNGAISFTSSGLHTVITRTYDPEKDVYKTSWYSKKHETTVHGCDIDPEMIKNLVTDLVAAVPTIQLT